MQTKPNINSRQGNAPSPFDFDDVTDPRRTRAAAHGGTTPDAECAFEQEAADARDLLHAA